MRLISYDGQFDVLYDNVVLWRRHNDDDSFWVIASPISGEEEYPMCQYSSEASMESELRRLRNEYSLMDISVFQFRGDRRTV